ncbi:MAG: hypothetical protein QM504_13610 [Pseudomonadota bacterium]
MPGKSIHLQHAMGRKKLRGRDAIWTVIREIRTDISLDDLERKTKINRMTIKSYLQGLTAAGYLEQIAIDKNQSRSSYIKRSWNLILDIGVQRPYVDKNGKEVKSAVGRNQMWRVLKMMKNAFDKHELRLLASTEEHNININEVNYYLRHLAFAGYVKEIQKGKGGKAALYRFIPSKNTGPRAPMIQRVHQVFDPNLNEVVWLQEPREED